MTKEHWSLKREIIVKVSFLWEELSDATGRRFHGYGEGEGEAIKKEYVRRINEMFEVANTIYTNNENNSI